MGESPTLLTWSGWQCPLRVERAQFHLSGTLSLDSGEGGGEVCECERWGSNPRCQFDFDFTFSALPTTLHSLSIGNLAEGLAEVVLQNQLGIVIAMPS